MKLTKLIKVFLIGWVLFIASLNTYQNKNNFIKVSHAEEFVNKQDNQEINCLTVALFKEARGESLTGKAAVAQVILNRTEHSSFPDSICKVIKQKNQFSWYKGNTRDFQKLLKGDLRGFKSKDIEAYQDAKQIALKAFYGLPEYNPKLSKALYFVHKRVTYLQQPWLRNLKLKAIIGNHKFYG